MKPSKTIPGNLLYPPKWVICTAPAASFAALIFVFAFRQEESAVAHPIFLLSAYSLAILIAALPKFAGRFTRLGTGLLKHSRLLQKVSATAFGERYLHDRLFRSGVGIYQGMAANFLYMLFRFMTAARYGSVWFLSMAAYHMLLCIMRAYLAFGYRRRERGAAYELRCYRRTAGMLFVLNIPMGGMILLMVQTNSGFSYPGDLIYLSALYTMYMMALSVTNLVKFRKAGSPILSAAKALNFVSALMSVLGLQTAMIARFSSGGEGYRKMMNAITGGAVFTIAMATVAVMAVRSSKKRWNAMNRAESKYFNTALRMDQAFLNLLEKKDMEYITIKDICVAAGVNRSTFYLHYETIGDLLAESVQYMNKQFIECMELEAHAFVARIQECPLNELYLVTPAFLTPYLEYIAKNKRLFRTALKNSHSLGLDKTYRRMSEHVFTPILERFQIAESDRSYIMAFYIHGLMAVISEWLKSDCADSISHVSAIMEQCVMQGCRRHQ